VNNTQLYDVHRVQCLTLIQACARALLSQGIVTPSEPVVLYFEDNHASVIWYWATIIAGAVPALLPPMKAASLTQTNFLKHVSSLLKRPVLLTSRALMTSFEESEGALKAFAVEDMPLDIPPGTPASLNDPGKGHEHEAATYLFTSGSTGPSKAVEFSHAQLIASSQIKAEANAMDADKTFLSWISFDHSVSICELHLHAMFAGANQVMIPASKMTADPASFWTALSLHKISYTFTPNSFLAAANAAYEDDAEERTLSSLDFSSLRVLFCGGEANKVKTLEKADAILRRHKALPHIVTPVYGLSETCSAIFYNRLAPQYDIEHEYSFASVGRVLPGHSVRLVDSQAKEVLRGEIGTIQLRGPMIFKRYYSNEAATSGCMTGDGYFDTGDTGRFDKNGNLSIVGRTKEVLIINGQNYSSFDLEYAVERAVTGLTSGYTATFSVWLDDTDAETEDLVVLFNPEDLAGQDKAALRRLVGKVTKAATDFCGKRPAIVIPLPQDRLPKSSIGKLSRNQLKQSLLQGEFDTFKIDDEESEPSSGETLSSELRDAIHQVVRGSTGTIDPNTTLTSLGIDSLGHLRLKAAIERALPKQEDTRLSLFRTVRCRTLGEVDTYLSEARGIHSTYEPLVELAPPGSKTTLILAHPGNGEIFIWLPLLPYFPDRRILALRARGFEEGEQPFSSMDEMLDEYLAAIKRAEPSGPYCLLGRCFGGLLMFELTKRLVAQGDEVAFCGNIEYPINAARWLRTTPSKLHALDLLKYIKVIKPEQAQQWLGELGNLKTEELIATVLERVPESNRNGLSAQKIARWIAIVAGISRMAREYEAQGRVDAIDVFHLPPGQHFGFSADKWRDDMIDEWNDFVVQEVGQRVAPSIDQTVAKGALRFHYLDCNPAHTERAECLPMVGAVVNQGLGKREAERELHLTEAVV
jgi:acyl-CoA synthetase (AMP-forming)/AMP-acid ligase II/thioesterase domain-containing protein/acyl carrier protein